MSAILGGPELLFYPGGTNVGASNFTLNQSTDALVFVFTVPEDVTITRLGFRQATATGTAPTYRVSLQGVDASGDNDGTVKGGGSPASATFAPTSGGNNTWAWKTLDNSYAATRGEVLALVIDYSSGTIDGSNNCSFSVTMGTASFPTGVPYYITNDNGAKVRAAGTPVFGFGSSTTAYGAPVNSGVTSVFNSGSTPDEKALLLNVPTTFCSTYKISGVVFYLSQSAGQTFDLTLYDTDGTTVLQRTTVDSDHTRATGGTNRREMYFDDEPATLSAGSSYRLSIAPPATNIALFGLTVAAAADLDAYPFGSAWASGSTRTNAGAWTDDPLTRYGINPILADITVPAGGSGGALILGGPGVTGVGVY